MLNQKRFTKFSGKYENFEEISKIPRDMKCKNNKLDDYTSHIVDKKYKNSDKRLSYKNRRKINKDFKDFMNN